MGTGGGNYQMCLGERGWACCVITPGNSVSPSKVKISLRCAPVSQPTQHFYIYLLQLELFRAFLVPRIMNVEPISSHSPFLRPSPLSPKLLLVVKDGRRRPCTVKFFFFTCMVYKKSQSKKWRATNNIRSFTATVDKKMPREH